MKLTVTHTLHCRTGWQGRTVEQLLLSPSTTPQQRIERWSIDMPGFSEAAVFRDGFGNRAHLVSQAKAPEEMTITVTGVVETTDRAGVIGRLDHEPPPALFRRRTERTPADEALVDAAKSTEGRIAQLHALMGLLHDGMNVEAAAQTQNAEGQSQSQGEGGEWSPTLAHRFIGAARELGIPARYVTGYLLDGGTGRFHAWAEAFDERLGWVGFDPVLNLCPVDAHIRIASGLDDVDTAPVRAIPALQGKPDETVSITAES